MEHVAALIAEKGYVVENIDATIIAQKPKMRPHIPQMEENIAKAMVSDEISLTKCELDSAPSVLKRIYDAGDDGYFLYVVVPGAYVPVATEEITSDYIYGVLYIVDEQVSLALRVDPDFKGEIILSIPGEDGVKATFIYKNIEEIDGNYYVVLEDVPFCELAAGYDIDVKMYGELVESFNYSIANYANAMTVQNMGYIPGYARALSVFATLAAAYVA